jgi:hypothetical protein
MFVKQRNKLSDISRISRKTEIYHSDELRKLWASDTLRNWEIFSKKVMEVSF